MRSLWAVLAAGLALFAAGRCAAQGYGTDTQNVLTPASGGMAGVSLARPQDVPSAVFGNPATLTQLPGTQFTLGAAWAEPTISVTHDGTVTGDPFSGKSHLQGFLVPAIAASQDLSELGFPLTVGLGLSGLSGGGSEFRDIPNSRGATAELLVLGMNVGVGADLTERLSAGATLTTGFGLFEGGFPQISAISQDYALRGTFGFDYNLSEETTLGAFYQTKLNFDYPNAFATATPGVFQNVKVDQPATIGLGLADSSLMCGDLLLAADIYYKLWDGADFYRALFDDQWAFAFGAQLTRGNRIFRLGYSYSDNPIDTNPGSDIGVPIGQNAIEFLQATQASAIWKHRITAGVGMKDFLVEGLQFDVFAGGLLRESEAFGTHTSAEVVVYYVGAGLTWRFGAGCSGDECLDCSQPGEPTSYESDGT